MQKEFRTMKHVCTCMSCIAHFRSRCPFVLHRDYSSRGKDSFDFRKRLFQHFNEKIPNFLLHLISENSPSNVT